MSDTKNFILTFLLLTVICPLVGICQKYFTTVQYYTVKEGLSDNYVLHVFQDSKGYVWVPTTSGVNRFDGHEFMHLTKDSHDLSSNYVERVLEDKHGHLWFVSRGKWNTDGYSFFTKHLDIYDPVTDQVISVEKAFNPPFNSFEMRGFHQDFENNIWISTSDGSLYKYNGNTLNKVFQYKVDEDWSGQFSITVKGEILFLKKDQMIQANQNGEIIRFIETFEEFNEVIATNDDEIYFSKHRSSPRTDGFVKVWKVDQKSQKLSSLDLMDDQGELYKIKPEGGLLTGVRIDKYGRFWQFADERLLLFNHEGKFIYDLTHVLKEFGTPAFSIFINIGSKDNIWISTEIGLISVQLRENRFIDLFQDKVYNIYGGIVDDGAGNILINQNEILVIDQILKKAVQKIPLEFVSEMTRDEQNNIWIGDRYSGIHLFNATTGFTKTVVQPQSPNHIKRDAFYILSMHALNNSNEILVGIRKGGLSVLNKNTGVLSNYQANIPYESFNKSVINHFLESDDSIWLATNDGMYQMDKNLNFIGHYKESINGIKFNEIYHFHKDNLGIFWLGTNGDGLIKWDAKTNQAWKYGRAEGFPHERIYAVYEDEFSQLWLPSGHGLIQFNRFNNEVLVWLEEDGLPFDEFVYHFHYQTDSGELYLGGANGGVVSFSPWRSEILYNPINVTRYQEFDNEAGIYKNRQFQFDGQGKLNIKPSVSSVALHVSAFDYTSPRNTLYSYILDEKIEKEGISSVGPYTKDNVIRLNNLSYGDHHIKIMSIGTDNNKTRGYLSIPVFVEKPFYLKSWFSIGCVITFIALIMGVLKWRTFQLRIEKRKLEDEVVSRTKTIQLQKEKLEKAINTKDRLFAIIGHDLRGPLFSLEGLEDQINYLLETNQTDRLKDLGSTMEHSAKLLTETLNNLLNWSMSQMGRFPFNPVNIELGKVITDVYGLFERSAKLKNIKLCMEVQPDSVVYADKNAISTIIRNLVSNGIKFSHEGSNILTSVYAENGRIWISVKDEGVGMTIEQIERILNSESYNRKEGTKGEKGTGLGLSLIKDLIAQNNGKLTVQSQIKKGTIFTFYLPVQNTIDTSHKTELKTLA